MFLARIVGLARQSPTHIRRSCNAPSSLRESFARPISHKKLDRRQIISSVAAGQPAHHEALVDFDGFAHHLAVALRAEEKGRVRSTLLAFLQDHPSLRASASSMADYRPVILAALESLANDDESMLLDRLLEVMNKQWNFEIDTEVHASILRGFQDKGHCHTAFHWLQALPSKPSSCTSNIDLWNTFLECCMERDNRQLFWQAVDHIRAHCITPPNATTYCLIFHNLFQGRMNVVSAVELRTWIDRLVHDGVPFSRSLLDLLVDDCTRTQSSHALRAAEEMFVRHAQTGDQGSFCAQQISLSIRKEDDRAAYLVFQRFSRYGFVPTPAALEIIASALSTGAALHTWEARFGCKASSRAWENLLANVATGTRQDLLEAYRMFIKQGGYPTPAILHPVLRAYCSNRLHPPTNADILEAVQLFREYTRLTSSDESTIGRPMPRAQEDLTLYNTLLRALIHSSSISNHVVALSLLEELRARGIKTDAMTTTSHLILLMKTSRSEKEAFKTYQLLHKDPSGRYTLDHRGYLAVLSAFCKYSDETPAMVVHYMSMIKDMRDAGYDSTPELYTILLQQLARWTKQVPRNDDKLMDQLIHCIKRVHYTLSLDPTLVPDIALWNQLMDTYQRATCFSEAFTIWQTMFASRRFDHTSVSVILDACGFARAVAMGGEIVRKVQASGFRFNQHNWITWVECLCRCWRFDEAMMVLCFDMPKKTGMPPSEDIAKLILRFAQGTPIEANLHAHMKRHLADSYAKITSKR